MVDVFTPLSLSIGQVFQDGDPIYKIPNYQRPYSWKDDQVEKLWDDLYSSFKNNCEDSEVDAHYFLGSLIVIKTNGFEEVVDGQQRLTTLMILFNAVKRVFPEINKNIDPGEHPDVIKIGKIRNCITNSNDISRLRVFTHASNQNDFEEIIISRPSYDNMIKPSDRDIETSAAKRFENTCFIFKEKLKSLDEVEAGLFINYLFNRARIIKIYCPSMNYAIKLFQVLNDRGLDLSPADLIKSKLLSTINEGKTEQFIADWQVIENMMENLDTSLTDMFTYYQYYLLGRNPKKSLVEELEVQFYKKDSNEIIRDFKKFVSIYKEQIENNYEEKVISTLWYLPWSTYWKTIVLTAIHSSYPELVDVKTTLNRFYYLYWIAGKTLTSIKQTSFNLIGQIKNKESIASIKKTLEDKIKADEILELALNKLSGNIYHQYWAKPIFLMIEYNQVDGDKAKFIQWDSTLQLEHILPQSFAKQEGWNTINKNFATEMLHGGGNLTLLSSKKNIEAKNYTFHEKINIYKGNGKNLTKDEGITTFRISQKIVDDYTHNKYGQQWNETAIIDRYNWFVSQVGQILKIDTSSIIKST